MADNTAITQQITDCRFFYPNATGKKLLTEDPTVFTKCKIIVPTISIGNTPQLAVDALLTNANNDGFVLFGYYHDPFALESFVTAANNNNNNLQQNITLNIELYISTTTKTILIQQRCNILPKRGNAFYKAFFPFLESFQPQQIVMLTSLPNLYRNDAELQATSNNDLRKNIQWFTVEPELEYHPSSSSTSQMSDEMLQNNEDDVNYDAELEQIKPHATFTPPKPPSAALEQPLASILIKNQNKLNINYTSYNKQFVLDYKQFKRIKAQDNYSLLYADGLDVVKKSTNDSDNEKTSQHTKKYYYFPFPVKAGGMGFKLAKYARSHNIPLVGFVSLNAKGDLRSQAVELMSVLCDYILQFTSDNNNTTFKNIADKIATKSVTHPATWKVLFEGH